MSNAVSVEASGETVGEAKWAALRDLERLVPGLDRDAVAFQVVSEGERGLLGVGYTPARVVATTTQGPREDVTELSEDARLAREFVDRAVAAIGAPASTVVTETDEEIVVTLVGHDLGLLIGRHGQTIDGLQYLASAIVHRVQGDARRAVTIDAAGYRARRAATLESLARRSAEQAVTTGHRVELEAMTAVDRKLVHEALKDHPEVETLSEGTEPNRFVVVVTRRTV